MAEEKTAKKEKATVSKTVFGGNLNIRKEASLEADIVGILEDGAKIDVLGEENGFFKIKEGFVKAEFLK